MQQTIVITDTSVLINFLVLNQAELLARLPNYTFLVTEHVRKEVTTFYSAQLQRLEALLASGAIKEISVTEVEELKLFATLTQTGLGIGECSAAVVAIARRWAIAIDDKVATKRIQSLDPNITIIPTEYLVLLLIKNNVISVAQADEMKDEWQAKHRFRLMFGSFAEKI